VRVVSDERYYSGGLKVYKSVEHAYQAAKARLTGQEVLAEQLFNAPTSRDAMMLGKAIKMTPDQTREWRAVKEDVMFGFCYYKFRYNEVCRNYLLQNRGAYEATGHPFWGGVNGGMARVLAQVVEALADEDNLEEPIDEALEQDIQLALQDRWVPRNHRGPRGRRIGQVQAQYNTTENNTVEEPRPIMTTTAAQADNHNRSIGCGQGQVDEPTFGRSARFNKQPVDAETQHSVQSSIVASTGFEIHSAEQHVDTAEDKYQRVLHNVGEMVATRRMVSDNNLLSLRGLVNYAVNQSRMEGLEDAEEIRRIAELSVFGHETSQPINDWIINGPQHEMEVAALQTEHWIRTQRGALLRKEGHAPLLVLRTPHSEPWYSPLDSVARERVTEHKSLREAIWSWTWKGVLIGASTGAIIGGVGAIPGAIVGGVMAARMARKRLTELPELHVLKA